MLIGKPRQIVLEHCYYGKDHSEDEIAELVRRQVSEDVEIEERYSLSADQSRLDFEITITDPSTFTSPAHLDGYWLSLGESIQPYDCQR